MDTDISNNVQLLKALGDETRLRIVLLLMKRAKSVGEIAISVNRAQPTVSLNLKILVQSGIIRCKRKGKFAFYSIDQKTKEKVEFLLK